VRVDAAVAHRIVAEHVAAPVVAVHRVGLPVVGERRVLDIDGVAVPEPERAGPQGRGGDGHVGVAVHEDPRVDEGDVVDEAGRAVGSAGTHAGGEDPIREDAGARTADLHVIDAPAIAVDDD
jgi:hypothetical protein